MAEDKNNEDDKRVKKVLVRIKKKPVKIVSKVSSSTAPAKEITGFKRESQENKTYNKRPNNNYQRSDNYQRNDGNYRNDNNQRGDSNQRNDNNRFFRQNNTNSFRPSSQRPNSFRPKREDGSFQRTTTDSKNFSRKFIKPKIASFTPPNPINELESGRALTRKYKERDKKKEQNSNTIYKNKREDAENKSISSKLFNKGKSKNAEIKANPIPKEIDIMETITISDLAKKMNLKSSDLISKLMSLGVMATLNDQIDSDTATLLAEEYGSKVNIVSLYDETIIEEEADLAEDLEERAPIITIMGHVDHGKTKLLSVLNERDINIGEHGGITQHIGAYTIIHNNRELTFLDTPGHEAFTLMRSRGAQVTDIVVLVVSAIDGVMPQTIEAINHARDANVPIVVAINKIDLPDANPDRVKKQLSEYDLVPEEWGGKTIFVEISALKKQGLETLLDMLLLQADIMELKANKSKRAVGRILEAKVDPGRGVLCSILIQSGTLRVGDPFIGGVNYGKVKAIFNHNGEKIQEAGPSVAVSISGFSSLPDAGDPFQVTKTEKESKFISSRRQDLKKHEDAKIVKKITISNLYDSIQEGELKELKLIVKADVQGSLEALKGSLEKLSTNEVKVKVIHSSVGAITETDVNFASASSALIIGFHVRPTAKAQLLSEQEKVEIRKYNIIYDAINDIKSAVEGMHAPTIEQEFIGYVEVREVFKVSKVGMIAGCYVQKGFIKKEAITNVMRDGVQIHSGKISSLKRFKEDVKEVREKYECGIMIENYSDIQVGDIIEAFEIKKVKRKI